MPTYEYKCLDCHHLHDEVRSMEQRDNVTLCPECGQDCGRIFAAPHVMTVSLPDGTKRFDSVRASRQLEKAIKSEKDKSAKARLKTELKKLVSKEAS